MVEPATKLTVNTEGKKQVTPAAAESAWHPLENLRRDIDRLFEDFNRGSWLRPLRPKAFNLEPLLHREFVLSAPAVDVVEKDKAYEVTAELPGIDEKHIEVTLRNGNIVIKGEKLEEKEEKSKNYYVQERQFGSFERAFAIPEGVDADKISATFKKGVLTVTLPKTAEAQKPSKKIAVKTV